MTEASLTGAAKLFRGQQGVHRSGAKALQVESHELEAETFEDGGELGGDGGIERALQFLARDLNADDVSVMTDAKLAETEGANRVLAALDNAERFARDWPAILDAGRKTGGRRFIPDAQACQTSEIAIVLLG